MSINIVEYLESLKKNDIASYEETITELKEYLQNVEENKLTEKYIDYLVGKIKNVYIEKIDRNSECILDMERVDSIITDNIKNNIKVITYEANENERLPEGNVYKLIIYGNNSNKIIIDNNCKIRINNDVFSNISSCEYMIENMYRCEEFDDCITGIFKKDLGYNATFNDVLTYTLNCMFITLLGEITYNEKIFK
jgi:hypothetical protein